MILYTSMKQIAFSFYLWAFLILYGVINGYIFVHIWLFLDNIGVQPIWGVVVGAVFASTYVIGEIIQHYRSSYFTDALVSIGSIWFLCIVHFFFGSLIFDILWWIHIFVPSWSIQLREIGTWMGYSISLITLCMIFLGYFNAISPKIRHKKITIPKKNTVTPKLKIAVASDIHLGPINGYRHARRLVKKINSLSPDIILFPGDILDGDVAPVIRRDLGKYLQELQAPFWVFAVLGNHEYIGGIDRAIKYITDHSIQILRDEITCVAGITIIGRDDVSSKRFWYTRTSLDSLLNHTSPEEPTILMDHQPYHLEEAVNNKIDVQLSGHTHYGQVWPLNLIVSRIFEVSRWYKKKRNTHIIVSSGFGTWWPPIRTNSRAELWCLEMEFTE